MMAAIDTAALFIAVAVVLGVALVAALLFTAWLLTR